ncbi:kinase [Nocardia sp. NPDC052316]|uniref:kinase n=1 Tax=Nocardia sp. NPDC052316 TaxID=3364329 RepID=UPI0037C782F4
MSQGLVLYGPPASGKDTVTFALTAFDPRYRLFHRMKLGPGRTIGYRMVTANVLAELERSGEIVWENTRYDARYVIDRPRLVEMLDGDLIPVVHAGQPEVITAVRRATPTATWTIGQLWCPRDVAESRIIGRSTGDVEARLRAWDATPQLTDADISVDTSLLDPIASADAIHRVVRPS